MRASIIIAAHNEGQSLWKTVRSCIESVRKLDHEILIADDASDDQSVEETLRRFPHLGVHRHDRRQGASPTKHSGASNAGGEVLVFLDGHCNPERGAIERLVEDVERLEGRSIVTPTILALDTVRWKNKEWQVGHGYRLELDTFDCGWLPLTSLRKVRLAGRQFYESPAAIGCALAVHRELYDDLRGFDPHMRIWGVEDLDFSLKCWLMGHSIVHDPEARIGHRFRDKFDNYEVPVECILVNKLRMAYKNFTQGVWSDWLERCRQELSRPLKEHPEGLWACAWNLFDEDHASAEQERAYLLARRQRDEFWYAQQFGLNWPRLHSLDVLATGGELAQVEAEGSPSPCPGVSVTFSPKPVKTGFTRPADQSTLAAAVTATVDPKERVQDVTFRMGGTKPGYALLGPVTKDATTGKATFDVMGRGQSTSTTVTLIEAVCDGAVIASVEVKVLVPTKFALPFPNIEAKPPEVSANLVGFKSKAPVWFVPGDPELEESEVGLATSWHHVMTIQINGQFGQRLDPIYNGAAVEENVEGTWVNIRQNISNGTYQDPVGPFWMRLQDGPGWLTEATRNRSQYVFDKDDPIAVGWPDDEENKPEMPIGSFGPQRFPVKVAGHAVGRLNRQAITTRVDGVDMLEIQWPPQ